MATSYDRRTFLHRAGLTGAAGVVGVVAGTAVARPAAAADDALAPFFHGVASGDPTASSVVLWTRLTPPGATDAPIPVTWEIATDADFVDVVGSGVVDAVAANDFTVKVVAAGLAPFAHHWYRFVGLGVPSIVGRTKTAPAGGQDVDRLRFGLVSCANYEGGYFNAYARLAERNDLDAILCAGDYLYEYGAGGYGPGAEIDRVVEPALEMTELGDYRQRFAHYRGDPDLRRLHQLYPWITTWDDHETTNDSWSGGAENHDGDGSFDGSDDNVAAETGLDWEIRKKRAWKAYREWLPIDVDATSMDEPIVLYRSLAYGDLADVIVMDTRIEGRDEPLFEVLSPEAPAEELYDDDRRMISAAQQTFVEQALSESDSAWRIVLQQVMLMQWRIPGLPGLPALSALLDGVPDAPGIVNDGGNSVNGDAWDGYPAARSRLFAHLRSNDITDVVVLTGDIHTTWAAELTEQPFLTDVSDPLSYTPFPTGLPGEVRPLGVEFVCPSITSDNIDEILVDQGLDQQAAALASEALEAATLAGNLHIKSVDLQNHGYSIVDVSATETVFDTFFVPRLVPSDDETFHESWVVRKSGPTETGHRLTSRSAPAASRTGVPDAPDAMPASATPAQGTPAHGTPASETTASPPEPDTGMLPATGGGGSLLVGGVAVALGTVIARRAALGD